MIPKRDRNKHEREARYQETQHYLSLGYSQTETASMMNVSRTALKRWIDAGHVRLSSPVEVKAYRLENGLDDEKASEAPPRLERGTVIQMWGEAGVPKKVTPQMVIEELERQKNSAQSFDGRVVEDFSALYTRLVLKVKNMHESEMDDPQVMLNWVKVLELLAERIRKLEAESNDRDDPDDVVAERRELQQRRERLGQQYMRMSDGEEAAS